MSTSAIRNARLWLRQAPGDARIVQAVVSMPAPMLTEAVDCHVAAMCAQVTEKSLKGYTARPVSVVATAMATWRIRDNRVLPEMSLLPAIRPLAAVLSRPA